MLPGSHGFVFPVFLMEPSPFGSFKLNTDASCGNLVRVLDWVSSFVISLAKFVLRLLFTLELLTVPYQPNYQQSLRVFVWLNLWVIQDFWLNLIVWRQSLSSEVIRWRWVLKASGFTIFTPQPALSLPAILCMLVGFSTNQQIVWQKWPLDPQILAYGFLHFLF